MSAELVPKATSIEQVIPGVYRWSVWSAHHKVVLTSHAIDNGAVRMVFDPIPLADEGSLLAQKFGRPDAVILTNGNHERAVGDWLERYPDAIWAARDSQLEIPNLQHWDEHSSPFCGWKIFPLPGGASGETSFFCEGLSLFVFGDAVVNLAPNPLQVLPDKYCHDPSQLRRSLGALPDFEVAVFAHGEPLLAGASRCVRALL